MAAGRQKNLRCIRIEKYALQQGRDDADEPLVRRRVLSMCLSSDFDCRVLDSTLVHIVISYSQSASCVRVSIDMEAGFDSGRAGTGGDGLVGT